jgi:hypothetical protein
MKLIIAGSRSITSYNLVYQFLVSLGILWKVDEIIEGEASGVDQIAKRIGKEFNIPVKSFPADWSVYSYTSNRCIKKNNTGRYNACAGHERNGKMADYATAMNSKEAALVAIWDGESRGTVNMIKLALEYGLQLFVFTASKYWRENEEANEKEHSKKKSESNTKSTKAKVSRQKTKKLSTNKRAGRRTGKVSTWSSKTKTK